MLRFVVVFFVLWACGILYIVKPRPAPVKRKLVRNPKLERFCNRSFDQTFNTVEKDGFVFTGDIHDMWIRDSAAQVNQYIPYLHINKYRKLVKSVILKQHFFIMQDPYANSYRSTYNHHPSAYEKRLDRHGWVATRNFELDSGAYFFRLAYKYWKATGELIDIREATRLLLTVYTTEQHHETQSDYRYVELSRNGRGSKTKYTGMVWTGFRPSDDPCVYHYHIPDNIFVAVALQYVSEMATAWDDVKIKDRAEALKRDITEGLNEHGTQDGIYCYETDGLGNCLKMDDANIPSLLSIPYIDPDHHIYHQQTYLRTKAFALSPRNPYFYSGTHSGIGSPHTPKQHIWHLSMIVQAMLDHDIQKVYEIMNTTGNSLHESFHVNNPMVFTRHWFSWADSLFSEGWWCARP